MSAKKVHDKPSAKQAPDQEVLPPENQSGDQFALARRAPSALAADAPPTVDDVLRDAERQIEIFRGYVKLVARFVQPEDILVFGDQVYLPAKPCQDILSWARITVRPHWPVQETHYTFPDGDAIEFTIPATITDKSGRAVDVMGNRSTRDEFFGSAGKDYRCPQCDGKLDSVKKNSKWVNTCKAHGEIVRAKAVTRWLPLQDVDIPSVRKAAVTNLWNTALGAVGLRPTLKDLKDAGMDISKVKRIDFKSDRQEQSSTGGQGSQSFVGEQHYPPRSSAPAASHQSSAGATGQRTAGSARAASQPQSTGTGPQTPPAAGSAVPPPPPTAGAGANESPINNGRLYGNLQKVFAKQGTKGEYLTMDVRGVRFFMFDNRSMLFGSEDKPIFEALLDATGQHVDFVVEPSVKGDRSYVNAKMCLRVGTFEWEEDGTPVIRREPAGPPNPGITDGDLGF